MSVGADGTSLTAHRFPVGVAREFLEMIGPSGHGPDATLHDFMSWWMFSECIRVVVVCFSQAYVLIMPKLAVRLCFRGGTTAQNNIGWIMTHSLSRLGVVPCDYSK